MIDVFSFNESLYNHTTAQLILTSHSLDWPLASGSLFVCIMEVDRLGPLSS